MGYFTSPSIIREYFPPDTRLIVVAIRSPIPEIFSGGADYAGSTADYLAELAWLNRVFAKRADVVAEIVCGLPNVLKGALPW